MCCPAATSVNDLGSPISAFFSVWLGLSNSEIKIFNLWVRTVTECLRRGSENAGISNRFERSWRPGSSPHRSALAAASLALPVAILLSSGGAARTDFRQHAQGDRDHVGRGNVVHAAVVVPVQTVRRQRSTVWSGSSPSIPIISASSKQVPDFLIRSAS
jgi:hypothetical protein